MILVDDRIGSKEFASRLADLGHPVKIKRLNSADFAFPGRGHAGKVQVGIERKTIPDFVGSYQSGRFTGHQLPRLCAEYRHVVLLLEGAHRRDAFGGLETHSKDQWRSSGISWAAFEGILHTLAFKVGVAVRTTWGPTETTYLIGSLYNWWQKPWVDHEGHLKAQVLGPKVNPHTGFSIRTPSLVEQIAMTLPGVGVKGGRNAAKLFKTPRALFDAELEDWETLPGIGETKAKRIMEVLHGKA